MYMYIVTSTIVTITRASGFLEWVCKIINITTKDLFTLDITVFHIISKDIITHGMGCKVTKGQ